MALQEEAATGQRLREARCGGFDVGQGRLQDVLELEHGDRPVEREEHRLEGRGQAGRVSHLCRTLDR